MRVTHIAGIVLSGCVWLVAGILLTFKGLVLMVAALMSGLEGPLLNWSGRLFETQESRVLFVVFFAAMLGVLKARFVLSRTVKKTVKRLVLLPSPIRLQALFPWSYIVLVIGMMGLGVSLKYLPISKDFRAFIDIAVGSALINGAFIYFRCVMLLKMESLKRKK